MYQTSIAAVQCTTPGMLTSSNRFIDEIFVISQWILYLTAGLYFVPLGITTPLLFSPLALDIKANVIRKLITAFLKTVPHHTCLSITEVAWREEAQFAGPHELAMLLRWGLARIVRVERNVELRGFLSFDHYLIWKRSEAGNCTFDVVP